MYSMRITLPITLFEKNATFLDPNIYVVTLYEIVTRGMISTKEESGFARFARSTTIKYLHLGPKIFNILFFAQKSRTVEN